MWKGPSVGLTIGDERALASKQPVGDEVEMLLVLGGLAVEDEDMLGVASFTTALVEGVVHEEANEAGEGSDCWVSVWLRVGMMTSLWIGSGGTSASGR